MAQLDTTTQRYLHCRAPVFFCVAWKGFLLKEKNNFLIVTKLWKVVQSPVELMQIDFKFEASIRQSPTLSIL